MAWPALPFPYLPAALSASLLLVFPGPVYFPGKNSPCPSAGHIPCICGQMLHPDRFFRILLTAPSSWGNHFPIYSLFRLYKGIRNRFLPPPSDKPLPHAHSACYPPQAESFPPFSCFFHAAFPLPAIFRTKHDPVLRRSPASGWKTPYPPDS